ncbi:MAG: hypothetical protein WC971_06945 [Coriobacteriia bacterium]
MEREDKARRVGVFAVSVLFAVLLLASSGCAKTATKNPALSQVADESVGSVHITSSALKRGPRVAEGVEVLTLAAARKRAPFELRVPEAAEVPDDNTVVRVLPQGSDAGEGFYVQYKKYEVAQMPTNLEFDADQYITQRFLLDLSDPQSGFVRYRPVKIGSYDGVIGGEFTQVDGAEPVANAPAIVAWQVPAPAGIGARYLNMTVSAWDLREDQLLRVAESLNR